MLTCKTNLWARPSGNNGSWRHMLPIWPPCGSNARPRLGCRDAWSNKNGIIAPNMADHDLWQHLSRKKLPCGLAENPRLRRRIVLSSGSGQLPPSMLGQTNANSHIHCLPLAMWAKNWQTKRLFQRMHVVSEIANNKMRTHANQQ